ncbi:CapA family protein [Cellvibrio sp. pealriver]|uniref:CapA family protein n=1 Tax=Cellvibrio sp. pealriver TaxID=1622269 RepID=UPI001E41F197|nr:CapA family protein [Cellvibrio sp. pealriver]
MFVGDINLGEYYTNFGNGPGTFAKTKDLFSHVEHIFKQADLIAGNLEASICSIGLNPNEPESVVLRAAPSTANLLKKHNIKVLQVANNHSVQHGVESFKENLQILESHGLTYTGLNGAQPTIYVHQGIKIGFLAASDVPDNTDKKQNLYQRLDEAFIELVRASVSSVDHLIVMLHWGLEESTSPLPYQRELAKKLKDAGVRIVVGSHPHLFYEIEAEDNFVCAYSLGNFVFDLCWDQRLLKSGILEVNIGPDKKLETKVWPIEIMHDGAVPTPVENPVKIDGSFTLYNLGSSIKNQQIRKVLYHLRNIFKGNTRLKAIFFKRKILGQKKATNRQS